MVPTLTNGKPFARLSLIFGAPILRPLTKNGDLYQSGPILAWDVSYRCIPACSHRDWAESSHNTVCNDKGQ